MSAINTNAEKESLNASRMAAFAQNIDEVKHALDILYIPNNASGRNKFREKWPEFADYIFGEDLIKCDNEGAKDRAYRSNLEDKACQRRLLIKNTIAEMEVKSVDKGVLQFEYVGQVIDNFGPELSVLIYAPDVVRRVRPDVFAQTGATAEPVDLGGAVDDGNIQDASVPIPPNVEISTAEDTSVDTSEVVTPKADDSSVSDHKLSEDEIAILSNKPDDDFDISSYDHVSPIVTDEPVDTLDSDEETVDREGEAEAEVVGEVKPNIEVPESVSNPAPATDPIENSSTPQMEEENPAPPVDDAVAVAQELNPAPSVDVAVEAVEDVAQEPNPAPPIAEVQSNPAPPVEEPISESSVEVPVDDVPESNPAPASQSSDELLADIPESIVRPDRSRDNADQNFSVPSSNHVPSMDQMPDVTKNVAPDAVTEDIAEEVEAESDPAPSVDVAVDAVEEVTQELNPAPPIAEVQSNPAPSMDEPNPAPAIEVGDTSELDPHLVGNPAPPVEVAAEVVQEESNPAPSIEQAQSNPAPPIEATSNPAPPIVKAEEPSAPVSPLNLHKVKKADVSEASIGKGNVVTDEADSAS